MNQSSKKVHVQVAQSVTALQQASADLVNHVNDFVDAALANLPTQTPLPTLALGTPTVAASSTPTATPTSLASVELLSVRYLTTGVGCQADIIVRVTGSPATGSFHVWNVNYGPEGRVDAMITLPVGTYSGNPVTLSGHEPESYFHDVWFEYDGLQSNRLEGLKCPLLPLPTSTP